MGSAIVCPCVLTLLATNKPPVGTAGGCNIQNNLLAISGSKTGPYVTPIGTQFRVLSHSGLGVDTLGPSSRISREGSGAPTNVASLKPFFHAASGCGRMHAHRQARPVIVRPQRLQIRGGL